MFDLTKNPFQELYLTEALKDPELYLSWFSPTIITGQTEVLFRPGNVVLSGTNGAGKTMLLRLFSPEVQAASIRFNMQRNTVPRTLGVGINFVHAGFSSLGRRRIHNDPHDNLAVWALLLGDLINYYLVAELLKTLRYLASDEGRPLAAWLGAKVENDRLQQFAEWLAKEPSWFGGLDGVRAFDGLAATVHARLNSFRSFVNWNIEALPESILATKTEIGRPLAAARDGLAVSGILPADVPLSVTVDQYETLLHIDYASEPNPRESVGHTFCRVVNSFLARRDPSVSFKVGVRPYSWGREARTFGSDAQLELGRDYQRVDLDEVLRRGEDRSAWIFPQFAQDVAARRLKKVGVTAPLEDSAAFPSAIASLEPNEEIARYSRRRARPLVPRLGEWPTPWLDFLAAKSRTDPYGAVLAEVWMLQQQGRGALSAVPPSDDERAPWNREYWRKERKEAALTQLASECRQRKLYSGWPTIMTLSGGNILVFLSLCREIWDLAQRSEGRGRATDTSFAAELQSQAIWAVSSAWMRKQDEFPGGASRKRFVQKLGNAIRKALVGDARLSYPGWTGFSLADDELDTPDGRRVAAFLDSAADFGALVHLRHTTKEKDGRSRQRWYLFPVLCPYFDIPAARTKEPYYARVAEVLSWIESERPIRFSASEDASPTPGLFQ